MSNSDAPDRQGIEQHAGVHENGAIGALPDDRSAYVAGSELAWVMAKPGIEIKRLYESPDGRHRALLFRLLPGARSADHDHVELEQIHVLEGSFFDGSRWLRAGDHCVRAPGVMHNAWSEEGALALVTYTAMEDRPDDP